MKQLFILTILLVNSVFLYSQTGNRYVVFLTDKNNSTYSTSNPSAFLSQRSIDRRVKQNIPVVTNDLPVNSTYLSDIANTGAAILNVSKWFNSVTIQVTDSTMLAAIASLPFVSQVKNAGRTNTMAIPDKFQSIDEKLRKSFLFEQTNNASNLQKTATLPYGPSFHQIKMMNGDFLHDNGYTGNGLRIAVIDAGFLNVNILPAFDSLRAQNKIIATWDFVDHETNVYNDHHHGAMCFSIMGSNLPGVYIGSAPHAEYLLLRSEDVFSELIIEEYNWLSAAEYADSAGADILSTSLGYTLFNDSTQDHSYNMLDGQTAPMSIGVGIAASKGMIVLNSAGNEGNSPWNYISVPSDADSMLAVGAVDSLETYAGFSGNGPTFDGRVKPDVACMGSGTYVVSPWDSSIFSGSGTSFSCPLLAGLTACFWQGHPNLSNLDVIEFVKKSASQFAFPDTNIGYGIPDFENATLLTSLNQFEKLTASVEVFPNPSSGLLEIKANDNSLQHANLTTYDFTGRLITGPQRVTFNNGRARVDFQYLKNGIYQFQLITASGIYNSKIIIRH